MAFFSFLKGTLVNILRISEYIFRVPDYFEGLHWPCRAKPVCLQGIHSLGHALNQSTLHKVYKLLLGSTLASACQCMTSQLGSCAGFLGDAAAAGQLCTTRYRRVAKTMINGLLSSRSSPSQQCIAHGEWAFEGLGL
jgi:hypothetical protein